MLELALNVLLLLVHLLALAYLALAQGKHWRALTGQSAGAPLWRLRLLGWGGLCLSLGLAIGLYGAAFGVLLWVLLWPPLGFAVALSLAWRSAWLRCLAR